MIHELRYETLKQRLNRAIVMGTPKHIIKQMRKELHEQWLLLAGLN